MLKNVQSSYITWNKNKEDGWEKYKSLTESNEAFTGLIDNVNPATTDDMSKIESKDVPFFKNPVENEHI